MLRRNHHYLIYQCDSLVLENKEEKKRKGKKKEKKEKKRKEKKKKKGKKERKEREKRKKRKKEKKENNLKMDSIYNTTSHKCDQRNIINYIYISKI